MQKPKIKQYYRRRMFFLPNSVAFNIYKYSYLYSWAHTYHQYMPELQNKQLFFIRLLLFLQSYHILHKYFEK